MSLADDVQSSGRSYMTSLNRLKDEINREIDAVQQGQPTRPQLVEAREHASRERMNYIQTLRAANV